MKENFIFILVCLSLSIVNTKSEGKMRNITTMELTREMGIGINLGNTFDAFGDWVDKWGDGSAKSYFTCWGSPVPTRKMIRGIYDEGFRVLRIPVHWFNLMDEDYNLSQEYIDAVKQVVDWALEFGLYVIVNIHHDNGVLFKNFTTNYNESMYGYTKIWEQVAKAFKDYDDHLMLESLNEEACWDSVYNRWAGDKGKKEVYQLINKINQAFVDTVRESGGNNKKRHLLIAGYCTDIDATIDPLFKMPKDPIKRCAVSVHYYTPSTFTILTEDASWGKVQTSWGTTENIQELIRQMDKVQEAFIEKDIPVIIGEYGCSTKGKDADSVLYYIYSVCQEAYSRKMVPILWDTPGGFYNRTLGIIEDPKLKSLLMSIPEDS